MAQFLNKPEPLAGFKQGLGDLTDALGLYVQRKRQDKGLQEESEALNEQGFNIPNTIKNPRIRESLLESQKSGKKLGARNLLEQKKIETISKHFGSEAGELYPHLTESGKSKLFSKLLDGKIKGEDSKKTLLEHVMQNPQDLDPTIEQENAEEERAEEPFTGTEIFEPSIGKSKKFSDVPDYELDVSGRKGKDLFSFEKDLRGYNDPIYKESKKNKSAFDKSLRSLNDLQKLSKKIPSGISRFFFNSEGNIRPLAQTLQLVPPEAEEYVKIVNDFTTQAKDSYGARVTNFELDRFLKRLPTAINSEKGRELIIDRMKNIAEIDSLREKALQDVYNKHGLGKILPEDAEVLADELADRRSENLMKKSKKIADQLGEFEEKAESSKSNNRRSLEEIFG